MVSFPSRQLVLIMWTVPERTVSATSLTNLFPSLLIWKGNRTPIICPNQVDYTKTKQLRHLKEICGQKTWVDIHEQGMQNSSKNTCCSYGMRNTWIDIKCGGFYRVLDLETGWKNLRMPPPVMTFFVFLFLLKVSPSFLVCNGFLCDTMTWLLDFKTFLSPIVNLTSCSPGERFSLDAKMEAFLSAVPFRYIGE